MGSKSLENRIQKMKVSLNASNFNEENVLIFFLDFSSLQTINSSFRKGDLVSKPQLSNHINFAFDKRTGGMERREGLRRQDGGETLQVRDEGRPGSEMFVNNR